MAASPSHTFGQIIGDLLEAAVALPLHAFASQHSLYLDQKGERPARRGRKVSWRDLHGNRHDLDFVLERGGDAEHHGTPIAFIETAWRRYTKHSRNKAQEIQGAILPLLETYRDSSPFAGVVLAGVFTEGALTQLQSLGFSVLYFPYESVVAAFTKVGVDAQFDETTPDAEFERKVLSWRALQQPKRDEVAFELLALNSTGIRTFMDALSRTVLRTIRVIRILPLYGSIREYTSVDEAIEFTTKHTIQTEDLTKVSVTRYEIEISYSNGDRITGQFTDKQRAIQFLEMYRQP